jgi:LacI family transcriptional regulator
MEHKTVELVFDALNNANNLEMLKGVLRAAEVEGCHVAVSTQPPDLNVRRWVNELQRIGRAGTIIATSRLTADQQQRLDEADLPLVLIDPINEVPSQLPCVGVTNWQGGMSATQHLLDLGHRRIAMMRGYKCLVDDARYHGYVAALSTHGINLDKRLTMRANFKTDEARIASESLLKLPDRPTAVFAANDLEAFGVMQAARHVGLRVPQDLSIVGFDDSVHAAASTPQLTTVRQPFAQMGETAYRILVDRATGRSMAPDRVEIASTLVIRGSTARVCQE